MSAQPAEDDYVTSQRTRSPFRRPAEVILLARPSSPPQDTPPPPEQNQDEAAETSALDSGTNSGARITLSDISGDWASVTTVWTDAPQPLCDLVGQVQQAREDADAAGLALACWAVLVVIPRGLLHLASWVLAHPLRLLAVAVVAAVFIATL